MKVLSIKRYYFIFLTTCLCLKPWCTNTFNAHCMSIRIQLAIYKPRGKSTVLSCLTTMYDINCDLSRFLNWHSYSFVTKQSNTRASGEEQDQIFSPSVFPFPHFYSANTLHFLVSLAHLHAIHIPFILLRLKTGWPPSSENHGFSCLPSSSICSRVFGHVKCETLGHGGNQLLWTRIM